MKSNFSISKKSREGKYNEIVNEVQNWKYSY